MGWDGFKAPLPLRETVQSVRPETAAMKPEHFISLAGKHAFHLVVASFDEFDPGSGGGKDFQFGREAGMIFVGKMEFAGGKERDERGGDLLVDFDLVAFGHLVFGRRPALYPIALIRDEQHPGGVLVEPAHGGDRWVSLGPTFRNQFVDRWTLVGVVGADVTGGFIEDDQDAVGAFDGLTVDEDLFGGDLLARIPQHFAIEGDASILEPSTGLSAGTVTVTGQQLIDAHAGFGTHGGIE